MSFFQLQNNGLRSLKSNIDLVDLTDFDVQLALTQNDGVQVYEVLNIVTQFMIESFQKCLVNDGSRAQFGTIVLLERPPRRQLTQSERELETHSERNGEVIVGELFTVEFKGATLFDRNDTQVPVPPSLVEGCQRQAFLQDDILLNKLQTSSAQGLGSAVVDVRAYINPYARNYNNADSNSNSLEVVILIAIAIACVAFLFLVFAIFWAWRYDKKNRDAYLSSHKVEDRTVEGSPDSKGRDRIDNEGDDDANIPSYPSVIGGDSVVGGVYPESVISEDINSSLSQYYQSGLQHYANKGNRLQDAGSVSSMESYGYSLEGYAPSLATPMPADGSVALQPPSVAGDTSVGDSCKGGTKPPMEP